MVLSRSSLLFACFFDPCARNNHRHQFVFFCINFFLSSSFVLFVQCSSISFTNMVEITLTGISTVCVFGAIYHVHSLRCVCDVHGLMTAAGCCWLPLATSQMMNAIKIRVRIIFRWFFFFLDIFCFVFFVRLICSNGWLTLFVLFILCCTLRYSLLN